MEAISTTVPSINVRKLHPKPHHLRHLKPSLHLHHHPISVAGKPPTSISTKPTTPSHHTYTPHHLHPPPSRTQTHHRNATTGYAAALIDAALSSNSLDAIYKDVKRLLKWLQCNEMLKGVMADPLVEEGVKGRVVKEVAEKGKLRRQVVAMVKMLVAKSKAGMVVQVMEEFEGIYYQLNTGLRVVA
ncbi:putative ATPase, OSCP/delta subunit, F1F0 ATP synthase OSCP/delta subunit domain superfamily [Helianthus annuus]|nr:putative ATPase, OSCP/delta subunit, F1F0 ATP synthase OSCP/delta subunit domain superfamily [Helianthus annuus]